jgi:hypothetical protein
MTAQELRTRELLTRALPYLGPEGVEAVSAYLVGDRSFYVTLRGCRSSSAFASSVSLLLHWACRRPGGDWEQSAQSILEKYLTRIGNESPPSTTTP